ncbi:hypothetical protein ACE6H2_013343 [Prunus campanulata]
MSFPFTTANTVHRLWILFPVLIILSYGYGVGAQNSSDVTNVGAIINFNSRIGKEQKAAMEVAAEDFNNRSKTHKLILHFRDSGRDPFRAASAAEELIKEKKVEAIVGMETWQEAAQVADHAGTQSKVPVISFAAPTITPPLMQRRWPHLIRMATDASAQMKCIADLVSAYHWKRVVVIYEDDGYGGAVGTLAVLSEALRDVGSKIEHRLILPRVSSLSDPNWVELEELLKLPLIQSRVFIVLQSSLPTVTHLFRVAKKMGLVERDSAWIITESIASLLDSLDSSDMSTMEGTLGTKTYYAKNTNSYAKFQNEFQTKFSEEDNSKPGIYALRAFDTMTIITQALRRMTSNSSTSNLQELLNTLFNNYTGLSGKMYFKEGGVLLYSPKFRIINIVDGKTDKELISWTPEVGFSPSLVNQGTYSSNGVGIIWPGNITSAPKGWAMPTDEKKMRILVPGITSFYKFVKVDWSRQDSDEKKFDGFCIALFKMIVSNLSYSLPYEIEARNGSYDSLLNLVQNKRKCMFVLFHPNTNQRKTYDAVVGDITVLSERLEKVDFTQPYLESGLSMIVPENYEESTWLFLKPFTWQMWVVTGGILIYTTLIVWFLERPSNPEFGGPFKDQIRTATWFTFSSLFFAHREKIYSNLTRVVVIEWLFVVLILSSSYTANLSSMLTIKRLDPNVTDIEMLKRTDAQIGSDADSFIVNYLEVVLGFKNSNIIEVGPQYNVDDFKSKRISAAFLELPYAEVFINQNCKGYTSTAPNYRFGGFSFAFQQGSPIARDFTKAILELLEKGELKKLQTIWLTTPKGECSNNATSNTPESLSLKNFSGLFVITSVTSTLCLLLSLVILMRKFQQQEADQGNASPSPSDGSLWNRTVRIAGFINHSLSIPKGAPSFANVEEWSSPLRWDYTSTSNTPEHPQALMEPAQIEFIPQESIEQRQ